MDLSPYLDSLRRDLTAAAAPGGESLTKAAESLSGALDASARLNLLQALVDASAEITTKLDGTSVEVRLRGREADFVVNTHEAPAPTPPPPPPIPGDAELSRITLRLPEPLKELVERAATAEGISVNAWLVRAVSMAIGNQGTGSSGFPFGPPGPFGSSNSPGRINRKHISGYAQA